MGYVIQAVLSSAQHPEYGQITIPFPIPRDDYDHTIDLLFPFGFGAPCCGQVCAMQAQHNIQ